MSQSRMRMNWDLIPTQSQSSYASCHQPLAFDNNQKHRVKSGSAGSFMDTTQVRDKVRKGNTVMGGKRHYESREQLAIVNLYGAYAPVYENPPDRVFRNGQWRLITDLNHATRDNVARHGLTKRNNPNASKARNKRLEAAEREAQELPPRQKRLVAMRQNAEMQLFGKVSS